VGEKQDETRTGWLPYTPVPGSDRHLVNGKETSRTRTFTVRKDGFVEYRQQAEHLCIDDA